MDAIGGRRKHGPDHPIGLLGWLIQACLNRMASIDAGWVGRLGSWGLGARMRQGPGTIPKEGGLSPSHPVGYGLPPTPIATATKTWPSLRQGRTPGEAGPLAAGASATAGPGAVVGSVALALTGPLGKGWRWSTTGWTLPRAGVA